jgi:hypothetical protein
LLAAPLKSIPNHSTGIAIPATPAAQAAFKAQTDTTITDEADKRAQLIRHLEDALALADEIEDGQTGYLIERALDEARSRQFRPIG